MSKRSEQNCFAAYQSFWKTTNLNFPNAFILPPSSFILAVLFLALRVRSLDAELFQTILKCAESQPQEFGGLRYVVICLLHSLHNQAALYVLERDAFGRQLERAFRLRASLLPN